MSKRRGLGGGARFAPILVRLRRWPRVFRALRSVGCLQAHPEAIARGVGIGLFIGLTPTVGGQIAMMLLACWLLRGHFLVAFALSWVSNPLTMAPLYWASFRLGEWMVSPFGGVPEGVLAAEVLAAEVLAAEVLAAGGIMVLGSLPLASLGGLVGYGFTRCYVRPRRPRRVRSEILA